MAVQRAALLLGFAAVGDALKITPSLDPKSDKKFFGKDYPDDGRAFNVKDANFGHPYPSVQKTVQFDADYVKDENSDSGEWQAQINYDVLRAKVRKAKQHLAEAEGMTAGQKEAYDKAYQKAVDAGHSAEEAKKKAEDARSKHEKVEAEKTDAETKAAEARKKAAETKAGKVDSSSVDNAEKELAREEMEFEKCKKELADAKAALQKAQDDAAAAEKNEGEKSAAKQKEYSAEADKDDAEAEALKGKVGDASAAEKAAADEAAQKEAEEKQLESTAGERKKKADNAKKSVAEAQADLDKAEENLEKAEERLKYYRKHGKAPPADESQPGDGSSHFSADHKSSAMTQGVSVFAVALIVVMMSA